MMTIEPLADEFVLSSPLQRLIRAVLLSFVFKAAMRSVLLRLLRSSVPLRRVKLALLEFKR